MPKTTIQYTDNIISIPNFDFLFSKVHWTLNSIAGIKIENCKSGVFQLDKYLYRRLYKQ